MNPSKNLPTISQTTSSSDTESADIKATSTATATTTMGGVGVSAEEEESVNEQENPQQQQQQQQQKKAKRLPAFAVAILKRFNEKDSKKHKDNQESVNIVEGSEQENPAAINAIDGNDNEPKVLKNVPDSVPLSLSNFSVFVRAHGKISLQIYRHLILFHVK